MEKINPRVDIAFKKIFGVEENKDLLISLINSIVSEEDQVTDVTLLNPYNLQSFKKDKLSILDVKAKGHDGKRFNIEIQISDEADYNKRALYYWAKLYTEQLKARGDYGELCKAIGIHILNFTSIPELEPYHNVFYITEKETGFHYFRDLELHTVELKKFIGEDNNELNDLVKKVKASLDMWSAFLTRHDLLVEDRLPHELDKPELKKALHVLDTLNFAEEEWQAYEDRLKWLRIETNTLKNYFEKGRAEGMEEGIAKGIEKGKVEGIEQGIDRGIKMGEQAALIKIANTLLSEGTSIEKIAHLTGLTEAEIKELMVDK